jgi:CRP-like cAMP-binding protein
MSEPEDARKHQGPWCDRCALRQLPGFEKFTNSELSFMRSFKAAHRHAPAQSTLFLEGDAMQGLYTLFTGWACRYRILHDGRRQILCLLLPGSLIGIEGVLEQRPHYAVAAITDVTYCVLDQRLLPRLFREQPALAMRLLEAAMEERRLLDDRVCSLGQGNAEERVATLFVDLHERLFRLGLVRDGSFTLPITQQQLADLLGLNVIHTNRVLRRLRERKIVTMQERSVHIHDMTELYRAAGIRDNGEERKPLL